MIDYNTYRPHISIENRCPAVAFEEKFFLEAAKIKKRREIDLKISIRVLILECVYFNKQTHCNRVQTTLSHKKGTIWKDKDPYPRGKN